MPAMQIPNHAHCSICQRAIPYGDKTCSVECETKLEDLNKRRKRSVLWLYGLMALAIAVLILSYLPGFGGG